LSRSGFMAACAFDRRGRPVHLRGMARASIAGSGEISRAKAFALWLCALLFAALIHVAPLPTAAGGLELRHSPVVQSLTAPQAALAAKPFAADAKARPPLAVPNAGVYPRPAMATIQSPLRPAVGILPVRCGRGGVQARAPAFPVIETL
jgi:hypothetical protein